MERLEKLFENRPAALTVILTLWVGVVVGIAGGFGTLYKIIAFNKGLN